MAQLALKDKILQQSLAAAGIWPTGDIIFVSSQSGNDGNNGETLRHAVASLTRAIALAQAGDLIVLEPGGSETVTASLAVTQARLKIFCPASSGDSGFEINGATTLDLMTVSAANVHLEGLNFTRDAEAGTATAQVLTTAAADRIFVRNCVFDHSAFTSSLIGYGIELTDDLLEPTITKCKFVDCHRGILFAIATGKTQLGFTIEDNEFLVGQSTAFGIHNNPTSTGVSQLGVIRRNLFREMKGSGAAASNWDGTSADGTAGPYLLGALCDQFVSQQNVGDSVSGLAFDVLPNVSGTGKLIDNMTTIVSDDSAAVTSVGLAMSTANLSVGVMVSTDVLSVGVATSTDTLSVGTRVSTDVLSVGTLVSAIGIGPFASSAGLSTQVVATSTDIKSVGVLVSARATAAALSTQVVATSTDTKSVGTAASTDALSVGVKMSTDVLSVGALVTGQGAGAHATSAGLSTHTIAMSTDVKSVGVVAAAAASSAGLSTHTIAMSTDVLSVGVVAASAVTGNTAAGTPIAATKVVAMTTFHNNAQTAALWTATGDVLIHEIVFEKDGTPAAGATNFELTTDNTYGPTGNGGSADIFRSIASGLAANLKLLATAGSVTPMVVPFMLESGASLFSQGDDGVGSGGNVQVTIYGTRVTAGASLA